VRDEKIEVSGGVEHHPLHLDPNHEEVEEVKAALEHEAL